MLDKLAARTSLLLDRTTRYPVGRLLLSRHWVALYWGIGVFGAFSLLGVLLFWPIFGADYPSGVDTPTFLHLSWVTKLAASGQLTDPFQDPYWYGGFPYLVAYPPLGYGLVGVISAVTGLNFINVYVALLVMAYGGIAAATYWLACELGLRRWTAAFTGVLVALAYPVLNAIFLWGWFTSVLALPIGLVSFIFLEKSMRTGRWGLAAWGGVCMALSILTHHMTGLSLGLGLAGWLVYNAAAGSYSRRQVLAFSGLFAGVTALVVAPWGIPFTIHTLDVGFRREVPGLWSLGFTTYRTHIIDSGLIGEYVYQSYLGVTLIVLAIGGTVYALLERQRLAGMSIALLVLLWFSMGAELNPLIRVYPFSGLDTARFHLFMVPFMAILGGALVERTFTLLRDVCSPLTSRLRSSQAGLLWYALVVAVVAAVLLFPVKEALKARELMAPYEVNQSVGEAINWLAEGPTSEDGGQGLVYSVGLWNWDAFLIPYLADRPLVDGWADEGAPNVHQVRPLRLMGWTHNVNIGRAHELLSGLGAEYVLVNLADLGDESSRDYFKGFEAHPEWFQNRKQWEDVAVFQVLP